MDADEEHEEGEEFDEEFDEHGSESAATSIEVTGLSLYTHRGVSDAEQEIGQRLVIDLRFDVGPCDATVTDRVGGSCRSGKP